MKYVEMTNTEIVHVNVTQQNEPIRNIYFVQYDGIFFKTVEKFLLSFI